MPIALHIFEARYKLMVKHCIEKDEPFGVVLIRNGVEAMGPLADPHAVGCSARIASVDQQADDTFNITAVGDERFKIVEIDESQPYLVGKVQGLILGRDCGLHMQRGRRSLSHWVGEYLTLLHNLEGSGAEKERIHLPDDPLTLMYFAAALLQLPVVEKQPLLEANDACLLLTDLQRLYRREAVVLSHLIESPPHMAERGAWMN